MARPVDLIWRTATGVENLLACPACKKYLGQIRGDHLALARRSVDGVRRDEVVVPFVGGTGRCAGTKAHPCDCEWELNTLHAQLAALGFPPLLEQAS